MMNSIRFVFLLLLLIPTGYSIGQDEYPDSLMTITQPGENIIKNFGIFGSKNFVYHISEFQQLPGIKNCCPKFGNGSGSGFSIGIMTDFDIFEKAKLTFRPYFESGDGVHTDEEGQFIGNNGKGYDGIIEHKVTTNFSTIGLQTSLDYNIWESLILKGGIEAAFYTTETFTQKESLLEPKSYGTFENGSRTRNDTSGNLPDGASLRLGLFAGVGWELPLNQSRSLKLIPEITYSIGLSSFVNNYDWSLNILKLGAALRYEIPEGIADTLYQSVLKLDGLIVDNDGVEGPLANIEVSDYLECGKLKSSRLYPPAIRLLPEVITKSPVTDYSLKVMQGDKLIRNYEGKGPVPEFTDWEILPDSASIIGSDDNVSFMLGITTADNKKLNSNIVSTGFAKKSYDISSDVSYEGFDDSLKIPKKFDTLKIEETVSTNMRPLLTYVFFDKNSSKLPDRYEKLSNEEAKNFYIEQLGDLGTMETYYKILNIIGRRLIENDTSTILLTGCNSDAGVETNSFALSRARAESVKKYFVNNWGISPDRIRTKARNLPAIPSKTSEHDYFDAVRDENRRVEISAYDWKIVEPVVTFDTLRSITPENIRFFAETKGDIPVKSSKFNASIGTEELLALANDESDKIEGEINIVKSRNYFQQTKTRIDYTYEGRNSEGFACTTKGFVPYKVVIKDSTFDRYSLILFDFDSFTLSEANTRISNYINTRIAKSESGEVLGSAEIIGFTDVIGSGTYNMELSQKRAESIYNDLNIQSEKISYKGIGEEKPLYPDIYPEGRFYSRTVTITVINPRDLKNGR